MVYIFRGTVEERTNVVYGAMNTKAEAVVGRAELAKVLRGDALLQEPVRAFLERYERSQG